MLMKSKLFSGLRLLSRNGYLRLFSTQTISTDTQSIKFPKESSTLNYALNWQLAKIALISRNQVLRNTLKSTSKDNSTTEIHVIGKNLDSKQFDNIHRDLIKQLSKEKLYVEDGELNGIHVRIISNNENLASTGRALLHNVNDNEFSVHVNIIVTQNEQVKGKTFVNPKKSIIITSNASEKSLAEAIGELIELKVKTTQ